MFSYCSKMVGAKEDWKNCDWKPSRFKPSIEVLEKSGRLDMALKEIEDECKTACDEESRKACWDMEPDPECYTGRIRRLLMGKK